MGCRSRLAGWQGVNNAQITPQISHQIMNKEGEITKGIERLISHLNPKASKEVLKNSPKRVLKYFTSCCKGYQQDPKEILSKTFDCDSADSFVMLKNIHFQSMCEHHLLPIIGTASVAYFPKAKVVGISKLARVVDAFANRLQLQERMTKEIGQAIEKYLPNNGVAVYIEAQHYCMKINGVKKADSSMSTTYFAGKFKQIEESEKFMSMLKRA